MMFWLALLPYVVSGQLVWVQDGPTVDDAWAAIILVANPWWVVLRINGSDDRDGGSPYLVTIPLSEIRAVRERYPPADRNRLDVNFRGPDASPARARP